MTHQEAAQMIGALTDRPFQGLKFLRARDELWILLHLFKFIENVLNLPGVIGIS